MALFKWNVWPSSLEFAGCNEKYDGNQMVGCSTTIGPFLIPGPTFKVQDNGIRSLPSQDNLKDSFTSRSKQSKN
ncbi:hypothetical protein DFAR_630087 [Desulfarculales bacterium]